MGEEIPIRAGRPSKDAQRALEDRIITVADRVFVARGYDGASMAAIAAQARVGKQTLYRRYPDKAALFRAVFSRRIAALATSPDIPANDDDPVAEIRALARASLEVALDPDVLTLHRALIAAVAKFPELAIYAGDWGGELVARCAAAVARAAAQGLGPSSDPKLAANALLWSIVGDALYRALTGAPQPRPGPEREAYFQARWRASIFGEERS